MRRALVLCPFAVLATAIIPPTPLLAQPAPTVKGCTDVTYNHQRDIISARCKKTASDVHVPTDLHWVKRCAKPPTNRDGLLGCERPGSKKIEDYPQGPWIRSCRDFFQEGNQIFAICRTESNELVSAVTSYYKSELEPKILVAGTNGQLKYVATGAPPGSYLESCATYKLRFKWASRLQVTFDSPSRILSPPGLDYFVDVFLTCKKDGKLTPVSWVGTGNCMGDISNKFGTIMCQKPANQDEWPRGSYRYTCRAAKMESIGPTATFDFSAECRTTGGAWSWSKLRMPCRGNINNNNGTLVCEPL